MSRKYKYPRTPHLPWSPGFTSDDIFSKDISFFSGKDVVVTEKMDGENTTMYRDCIHARSLDSRHHVSRDWVKALHSGICWQIPEGWRFCGENLFAVHSLAYSELKSYFYLFSIWNENNRCLSWEETEKWAEDLNFVLPKVLYQGPWDEKAVKSLVVDEALSEGYVVRNADSFSYDEFKWNMAKWVRPGHVISETHWMYQKIVPNGLKND